MPDGAWGLTTFNGLTVRELVIHLASMESTVAAAIGSPTVPDVTEVDIERRTAILLERFGDRPMADVRAVWQASVEAIRAWFAGAPADAVVPAFGLTLGRDSLLVTRAFETWTHADDIRRPTTSPSPSRPSPRCSWARSVGAQPPRCHENAVMGRDSVTTRRGAGEMTPQRCRGHRHTLAAQ